MKKLDEKVVEMLNAEMWWLGTCGDEPNVVPVGLKEVTADGQLVVGVLHLNKTIANLEKNNKIAVSVCGAKTMVGYQIKGTAEFTEEGAYAHHQRDAHQRAEGAGGQRLPCPPPDS